MAAPATPADAWTVVEEFAAARELREIDGATLLAPVTADLDDGEAEIVENITREEMQKTVARLYLGEDEDTAQVDQVMGWPESTVPSPPFSETTKSVLDDEHFCPGSGRASTKADHRILK